MEEQNIKMEKIGEELPSKEQACTCTKQELRGDYPDLRLDDDCPVCRKMNHWCLIGSHRSETTPQAQENLPIDRFLQLLPENRKPVDNETLCIIQRVHGNWLAGLSSETSAIELLETAGRHVHESTKYRIKKNNGFLLDGVFEQSDSTSAELSRAFDVETLAPKIIKFGEAVNTERMIFEKLEMSEDQAIAHHLVPVRYIRDGDGKQGIVMPSYACSLSSVDCNFKEDFDAVQMEPAVLRGMMQIKQALSTLHAKKIIHNDVKPGNILIDFAGGWHLTDYGSCTCDGIQSRDRVKYTSYYHPSDFNKQKKISRNSEAFDFLLLAVTVLDRLQLLDLKHHFTIRQLTESIAKVCNKELRESLTLMATF